MFILHCEHGTVCLLLSYKHHVCNVCTLLNLNMTL